ncbi:Gpi16 subunit GPI transamidase component [Dacryopinax primogenitus]|uniref:Gpi16 subunit GPI transamidase component n=1 Tax=Dacryopinax primogenitus (strain DJM 731) TaxID=1858805 RepID=M5G4I5_DACPD|nr:Gpi16 subunit GPI transamidase component [Dacryopinax primogenitus]EJU05166.1 Gpi16 subunit GPI transamidase component [Dacryopinax primogenitus]
MPPLPLLALILTFLLPALAEVGQERGQRQRQGREQRGEQFSESLTLRPLLDGKVHTRFAFEFSAGAESGTGREGQLADGDEDGDGDGADAALHTTLLPLSLTQLLRTYDARELHLSLNAGKWDALRWGNPSGALRTGGEMWAWFAGESALAEQEQGKEGERVNAGEGEGSPWQGLTNGLAGLFCASLSSQTVQRTTEPLHAFRPEGDLPSHPGYRLFHAAFPSESVCTENLTPFLKLLPCKSRAGIAQLLNPHKVFSADWHGVGVHVLWKNDTLGLGGRTELRLEVNAVFDPVRVSGKRDWSLRTLFDRSITRSCPAASSSLLKVHMPTGSASGHLLSPPLETLLTDGVPEVVYDLSQVSEDVDISMRWEEDKFDHSKAQFNPPELSIRRSLKGSSGPSQLSVILSNTLPIPRRVLYVETLPWFLSLYLHTLHVQVSGVSRDDLIQSLSYLPPVSPKPTLLELTLLLPPQSEVHITMQVEKGFIRYTEHQPDASRGWDLPAAVVFPLPPLGAKDSHSLPDSAEGSQQRIYSSTLLVDLPTPDFSMPYNVIIMSSTLVALFFGHVFNSLTRKFVLLKVDAVEPEKKAEGS